METFECLVCGEHGDRRTCPRCFSRLRGMLAALPEEFVRLSLEYQPSRSGGDGRSGKPVHPGLPCREDVLSLLGPSSRQAVTDARDQVGPVPLLKVLASWAEVVTEERHLTGVRRNVTTLVDRLTRHLNWIAEQPWVGDFYREVEDLLRVVTRITGTQPQMELIRGVTCPTCQQFTLVRYYPSDWRAQCRFCEAVRLDQADYDALVRGQVTEQTRGDDVNT